MTTVTKYDIIREVLREQFNGIWLINSKKKPQSKYHDLVKSNLWLVFTRDIFLTSDDYSLILQFPHELDLGDAMYIISQNIRMKCPIKKEEGFSSVSIRIQEFRKLGSPNGRFFFVIDGITLRIDFLTVRTMPTNCQNIEQVLTYGFHRSFECTCKCHSKVNQPQPIIEQPQPIIEQPQQVIEQPLMPSLMNDTIDGLLRSDID